MDLQHSKVQRGGVTSPYWYGQTTSISSNVSPSGLRFSFSLPSKGGGDTSVLLTVGPEDLRAILKELAAQFPDLADTFAESTRIAVSHLMKSQEDKSNMTQPNSLQPTDFAGG